MKMLSTMKLWLSDFVAEVAMSETITDESANLDHMERRDIQISCIAAKSMTGPPKACRT
jgi:hypothetical protein